MALVSIAKNTHAGKTISSAREIADEQNIPYSLLSKVMQQLANLGIIKAVHGTHGGYLLAKPLENISLAYFIQAFEGSFGVAECFKEGKITCQQWDACSIKSPFTKLNLKIQSLLNQMSVSDLYKN